jgi:hydrogenase maturation factor
MLSEVAPCSTYSGMFSKVHTKFEGEILETLWSDMDEVAAMAQAMLVAHHQKVVDDHMNDSNW